MSEFFRENARSELNFFAARVSTGYKVIVADIA